MKVSLFASRAPGRRSIFLAVGALAVILVSPWLPCALAIPIEEGDLGVQKGAMVVTLFDSPLKDEDRTLYTIPAGTELRVEDVNGLYCSAIVKSGDQQLKGWVYGRYLRTPLMLTKLVALGDEFKGYRLLSQPLPSRPQIIAIRRFGDPKPMPRMIMNPDGSPSFASVPATDEQRLWAGGLVDGHLQSHFVGRLVAGTAPDSQWQVLVSCGELKTPTAGSPYGVIQYGDLFVVDRASKCLVFQKSFAGAGFTEGSLLLDFARQAAEEYGTFAGEAWSAEPAGMPYAKPFFPFRPGLPPKPMPPMR